MQGANPCREFLEQSHITEGETMKDTSKQFNKVVGSIVKKARERHGMTQRALADKMGVAQESQCRREAGTLAISTRDLARYAAMLGFGFRIAGYYITPGGQARRAE